MASVSRIEARIETRRARFLETMGQSASDVRSMASKLEDAVARGSWEEIHGWMRGLEKELWVCERAYAKWQALGEVAELL